MKYRGEEAATKFREVCKASLYRSLEGPMDVVAYMRIMDIVQELWRRGLDNHDHQDEKLMRIAYRLEAIANMLHDPRILGKLLRPDDDLSLTADD